MNTGVFVLLFALVSGTAIACEPKDGDTIKRWIAACDAVSGSSRAQCDDRNCHTALHRLIEEDTIACWKELSLTPSDALEKYGPLDAFCHGEGPDPAGNGPTASPGPTPSPSSSPSTSPPSSSETETETPAPSPSSAPSEPGSTAAPPSGSSTQPNVPETDAGDHSLDPTDTEDDAHTGSSAAHGSSSASGQEAPKDTPQSPSPTPTSAATPASDRSIAILAITMCITILVSSI